MEAINHHLVRARSSVELAGKPNLHVEAKVRAEQQADYHYAKVADFSGSAAPFVHPRLAYAKIGGDDGGPPIRVESLTRPQLATLIARIRAGHHLDRDPGGDGEDAAR
jgi:hypothetical protein